MLGVGPRASRTLGKYSTTDPHLATYIKSNQDWMLSTATHAGRRRAALAGSKGHGNMKDTLVLATGRDTPD